MGFQQSDLEVWLDQLADKIVDNWDRIDPRSAKLSCNLCFVICIFPNQC